TYQVLAVLMMQGTNPWGLQRTINDEIRGGEINRYLMRPMSYRLYRFMRYFTSNVFYCVVAILPLALVIAILGQTFVWTKIDNVALAAVAFVIGMAIQFLSVYAVAMAAFWLDEIAGLFVSYMMLLRFVSGEMFPLDLLPAGILDVLRHTPFPNIIWFPLQVYLGRMSDAGMAAGFLNGLLWVGLLWILSTILWRRGIRQYGGFGG
ncbi:MAG: ABC-2 family transporter protein, partial [Planctomycetaceae bacterium]|nr:ABC-2 family transporter protein [Planctomycetaceae bacterium]